MSNKNDTESHFPRILIADDNPKNIQVLGTILRQQGYQIVVAQNGNQALKAAGKAKPDLILLDVMMPELDGFETCKQLKRLKFGKDIPVIFLTAKTEPEDIAKGFELGAVDYITKPFNAIELLSRVRTHIELRRRQKLQGAIEMAGAVCHEMNQPLQSILGYSDLLLMELDADSPAYGKVVKIAEQIEKMGQITKKLMGISLYVTKKYPDGQKIVDIDRATTR